MLTASRTSGAAWVTVSALAVMLLAGGLGAWRDHSRRRESPMAITQPKTATPSESQTRTGQGGLVVSSAPQAPRLATAKPSPAPTVPLAPASYQLEGVPADAQRRRLSCEFQSAADLAWYYGVPVTWQELFDLVGYSLTGDPQEGFAGASIDDAPGQLHPAGYGVYAEPIAAALHQIGLPARAYYGEDERWLRRIVASGRPVMIWAVAGMRPGRVETWLTTDGRTIEGVRLEHTFLVVGYAPDSVTVLDAYDGKVYRYSWDRLMNSWSVLGRMAVVIQDEAEQPLLGGAGNVAVE